MRDQDGRRLMVTAIGVPHAGSGGPLTERGALAGPGVFLVILLAAFTIARTRSTVLFETLLLGKWYVLLVATAYASFAHLLKRRREMRGAVQIAFLLYVVILIGSTMITTGFSTDSVYRSASLLLVYVLAFLVPLACDWMSRQWILRRALVLVSVAVVVSSYVSMYSGTASRSDGRFAGWMDNPNILGLYSGIAALSGLFSLNCGRSITRLLWFVLASASLVCLWLTGSRTAMAGVLISVVVTRAVVSQRLRLLVLLVRTVVILALLAIGYGVDPGGAVGHLFQERDETVEIRQQIAQLQFDRWLRRPLLGYGLVPGGFELEGRFGGEGSYPEVLVSGGLLGSVALLFGVLGTVYGAARQARQAGRSGNAATRRHCELMCAFLVFVLAAGVGESFLVGLGNAFALYLWLHAGSLDAGGRKRFLGVAQK